MSCNYKERVLAYLRGEAENNEETELIEKHLNECNVCQALVEGYNEKANEIIDIPKAKLEDDKCDLQKKVRYYKNGTRRIIIFTIIGLILGWFSFCYRGDKFIVTKIILSIPYKISEMIHLILHKDADVLFTYYGNMVDLNRINHNMFFPRARIASSLYEFITPVLIGGAMYGSLAFFTGNKAVFTLKRFMKFAGAWCLIILLWIGLTFGMNAMTIKSNNTLENISGFFLSYNGCGSGYYTDVREDEFNLLKSSFYKEDYPKAVDSVERNQANELDIEIFFGLANNGYMLATVNPINRYIVTDERKIYLISEDFAKLIIEYMNTNDIVVK